MTKINKEDFFKRSALGGVVIVLPVAIIAMGIRWLFRLITDLIQPLTNLVTGVLGFPEIVADLIVLASMIGLCFSVGWFVTTTGGAWFHRHFDKRLAKYAPGYRIVKEIVDQFFGDESKSPFKNGEIAMVKIFGEDNPTEVTAIVTSKHPDGKYTIFMPTGPNPTSGNLYHVLPSQVRLCPDINIEDAMRTVIACGAGTGDLLSRPKAEDKE